VNGLRRAPQALKRVYKLTDVGKLTIDRGESHIRDLVHLTKLFDDGFSNHSTINLANAHFLELALDCLYRRVYRFSAYRALFTRATQATANLFAVENLASAILFDDRWK
jgi:hypothetical protein